MLYDPIKDKLGRFFTGVSLLQRLFYRLLDVLFLRSWYVRRELQHVFRVLGDRAEVHVLDAGTGFGQYTYFIVRKFPSARVSAVDIKDDYLRMAQRFMDTTSYAPRVRFSRDDVTSLRASGPFDVVVCVDVMEHIEEDERALENFSRVLAPGGFVVINTPSDLGGSGVESEDDESFIGEHVRDGYNMLDLNKKLERAGLRPVKSIYTYGPFGSRAWTLSIKIPMQLLSASWVLLPLLIPYYLLVLPVALLLNGLDVRMDNATGTGLMIVAQKGTSRVVWEESRTKAALN